MRIVGLVNDRPANAEYRVVLPLTALAERGHETEIHAWDADLPARMLRQLADADAVVMWRLYMDGERRLAMALRDAGVAVVWDNDDDLVRVRPQVNTQATVAREQVHRELREMMRLADAVTTTSPELARRFRKISGVGAKVIDNYISPGALQAPRPQREQEVVIGWVAGAEHRADLKQLQLRSALERVLRRNPEVRIVSLGVDLGIRNDRYARRLDVGWPELTAAIAEFDIGIAPIADSSFNRARSRVKLKEYAAAGLPWLASPIGPYRGLGEEQGGRLVADPLWQRRLEELIHDVELRRSLQQRAVAWAQSQTITEHAETWEQTIAEAVERARARTGRTGPSPSADLQAVGAASAGAPPSGGLLSRLTRRRRSAR